MTESDPKKDLKKRTVVLRLQRRLKAIHNRIYEQSDTSAVGDLALLLLIFFIVTSSFLVKQGVLYELPPQNTPPHRVLEDKVIEIIPQTDGYLYRGTKINGDELFEKIKKNSSSYQLKEMVASIQIKEDLPYERLLMAIGICKKLELKKISVIKIK